MKLNEIKVMSSEFGVRSINTKRYKLKIYYELFSPHSAFRNPQSGMTLIEVILVMVIIGILAATILPRFNFAITSRASVDGAAYMIASDIRYVQECAMANRVTKSVVFTSGQSIYTFPATTPSTSGLDPSGRLPSGVTITTTITFTFNSLGEPTSGGGSSVTVSGGGQTKTISVVNYTGKVSIS